MDIKKELARLKAEGKSVLTLIIKKKYFDQIIAGTKKQEFREIKPSTERKYIEFDSDGYPVEDENGNTIPLHYDYILLYVGYSPDREAAIVECTGASTQILIDEENEPIFYFIDKNTRKEVFPHYYDADTYEALDENNNVIEDYEVYFREQITYDLGKVVVAKLNK